MSATVLSERECKILGCIVDSFVKTATPVGSRFLAKRYKLGISPATIRNVMNDLEEMGYLKQPHVSAGRVPTDKGYRFYVDTLISVKKLPDRDQDLILRTFETVSVDVNEILELSSKILAEISSQLGVVLGPKLYDGVFQKMELVSISENRVLAVISIKSGLVKTIMIEIESAITSNQLYETALLINDRLSGLTLLEVKQSIDQRLHDLMADHNTLLNLIVRSSDRLFDFTGQSDLHFGGTLNIMATPEFSDREYATKILELIETKQGLFKYLNSSDAEDFSVRIGAENRGRLFQECSVVSTRYFMGDISGTLAVVGPTRMMYSKIIPLVGFMGEVLTKTLHSKTC